MKKAKMESNRIAVIANHQINEEDQVPSREEIPQLPIQRTQR